MELQEQWETFCMAYLISKLCRFQILNNGLCVLQVLLVALKRLLEIRNFPKKTQLPKFSNVIVQVHNGQNLPF